MKKELELMLVNKYLYTLQEYHFPVEKSCFGWGFEHGDGWFQILDDLLNHIDYHEEQVTQTDPNYERVVFEQVKEKFGELRIYYRGGDNTIDTLVDAAVAKSYKTCEMCGEPGTPNKRGWISVRCDECLEKVRGI